MKMLSKKRIAIIGAGVSGIVTIKACKEEENLFSEIICYEKTDCPGGLWMYREDEQTDDNENIINNSTEQIKSMNQSITVMKGTIANSSKEMSAFSDFPPPPTSANFMHHRAMIKYILSYAGHFDCLKHIQYNSTVQRIEKVNDKMLITLNQVDSQKNVITLREVFDTVLIASGHHGRPFIPKFPGLDSFQGEIIHTAQYKKANKYADKKVLVVGAGNSGLDVAVEVSNVADEVYLSTRSGCWVLPRLGFKGGRPFDTTSLTRFMHFFKQYIHANIVSYVIETLLNRRFDHQLFGLRPSHPLFHEHPTINDQIASKIISGMINVRGDIDYISIKGVTFKNYANETNKPQVQPIDSIIFATGYHLDYPFLSDSLKSQIISGDSVNLYKYIFPIEMNDGDDETVPLAFVGVPNALGPLFPIAEIQSRWIVQVIKGTCKLPSKSYMEKHLDLQEIERKKKFTDRSRHGVQVEWIPYLDEIASEFGAKVNMRQLFTSDLSLWSKLFFGPSVPYQYRLVGPHAWPGARDAIENVRERIDEPFSSCKRYNEPLCTSDRVLINAPYRDHMIIYTLFYGILVVTLLDLMNFFF